MIASYKDLEVFKESYRLYLLIHRMTQNLPKTEQYEMGSQLRRAALSIPLNIAEGYGKKESELDFKRFLRMSQGSCNEVNVLIQMCIDLEYMDSKEGMDIYNQYEVLGRRINVLIKKWKSNL